MTMKRALSLGLAMALLLAITGPALADTMKPVNINTASAKELAQLKGVGEKLAEKIVQYREANGPFASPDDLMKVPGIGANILEKNQGLIVVD